MYDSEYRFYIGHPPIEYNFNYIRFGGLLIIKGVLLVTFNNIEEVEKYVLEQARRSLITVQEEVYMIVNRFVKQYYAEFSPEVYERTYQLYRSLVKSEIKKDGNGK